MNKLLSCTLLITLLTLVINTNVALGQNNQKEYLVEFDGNVEHGLLKAFGVKDKELLHTYKTLPVSLVSLTDPQFKALSKHPKVKFIEPNTKVKTMGEVVPWGITHVQATDTYNSGYAGEGIKVAILDTGIDSSHEDLNIKGGYSVFDNLENINPFTDALGHGTHVAGIIGAVPNNVGVVGIAPQAEIHSIKVIDNNGDGTYAGIIKGIEWALNNQMDIINISLGGTQESSILKEWVDLAYSKGTLIVAAAGNEGKAKGKGNTVTYPARFESVIAVSAVNSKNKYIDFSSTGSSVEVSAPGTNIYSTIPGNNYTAYEGTSSASPHVAGIAALVWSTNPELSNKEVRQILRETAINLGKHEQYGYGLVQGLDAVMRALP